MTLTQKTQFELILTTAHHDFDKMLNSYAFFKMNDKEISEDLVQKTFMKTWLKLVNGGHIDLMKAFLYHVLNDLIVDEYRKRKTTSLDALLEKGFNLDNNNSERFFNILDGKRAVVLIRQLPPPYRKIMTMRYVQDLSIQEMAHLTHQTKNSVTIQAFRGLKMLRQLYNPVIFKKLPTTISHHHRSTF